MSHSTFRALLAILAAFTGTLMGSAAPAAAPTGTITGRVTEPGSGRPREFVAVTLKKPDGTVVQRTASDQQGRFTLEQVSLGDYLLAYGEVGAEAQATMPFTVDARHAHVDLGVLKPAGPVLQLDKIEVRAKQQQFLNSIDRKVYNVGKEIQSTAGTAGDLLQNVPSVDVDIDGNVSLRGSANVLILINGRSSALMGRSRAEVLQQLPASEIEKIEVITNPSAKYKPDGTSGIINIALKQKHTGGLSGTANASGGNRERYTAGVALNYRPGKWNLYGSASVRQDDRPRFGSDLRTIINPATGAVIQADKHTVEESRPFTRLVRLGFDYAPGTADQYGVSTSYNRRTFHRHATDHNLVSTGAGTVTSDYDRTRDDPEYEQDLEVTGTYRHTFAEDHELNLELKHSRNEEEENNHYANFFRLPVLPSTRDNNRLRNSADTTEASLDYSTPLAGGGSLEAGYSLTDDQFTADFLREVADPVTGRLAVDPAQTNVFRHNRTVHAFYATYARSFDAFGFKAGLRPEQTYGKSRLINTNLTVPNDYGRVYPTLHLTYHLSDRHEFQLNYSHRVHRPEIDDLNPFTEVMDPFNLRSGNPRLRPEDIHSVEGGYSYHNGATSFTATLYDREIYHGFTSITSDLGGGVLLATHTNLATSNAAGLELTAGAEPSPRLSFNFSSNTYYNTIDASNLGYSSNRSNVAWLAKLSVTWHLPRETQVQFNTNYNSARLTPQGRRKPNYVANLGVRRDFWGKRAAAVLTVSDLFDSLKEGVILDTPLLKEEITRRRAARIIYLGFIYNFGQPAKKSKDKDDPLKFDNSL